MQWILSHFDVILAWLGWAGVALVGAYAVVQIRFINKHLPKIVQKIVDSDVARQVIVHIAHQTGLDNEQKRTQAVTMIREFVLKEWGISIPEHLANLAVELLVRQLKTDKIIPGDTSVSTPPGAALPLTGND